MKNIIIVAVAVVPQQEKTLEEQIQERILDLPAAGINTLMHILGLWDEHKQLMDYTPENIGELVKYGNERGWDVELSITCGRDYYLIAQKVEKKIISHTYTEYQISGLLDTFDEFAALLSIHTLVGSIAADTNKQHVLNFVESVYK